MTVLKKFAAYSLPAALFLILGLLCRCVFFGRSEKLWGTAFDVLAVNSRAYVCAGGSLIVLDVTDSRDIRLLGQIEISSLAKAVRISGNYAIVAAGERGLRIIDISDPTAMFEAGGIETPRYALGLLVEDDRVYVNSEGEWIGFDVTNPQNPVPIAFLPVNFSDKTEAGRHRAGNLIFMADNASLRVLDHSDPDQAVEIGQCTLHPESGIRGPSEIFVTGDRAYISVEARMYEYHLCIVDISDPADPREIATYDTPGSARSVAVFGDLIYVADGLGGLFVLRHASITYSVHLPLVLSDG